MTSGATEVVQVHFLFLTLILTQSSSSVKPSMDYRAPYL